MFDIEVHDPAWRVRPPRRPTRRAKPGAAVARYPGVRRILVATVVLGLCAPAAEAQLFRRAPAGGPPVAPPPPDLPPAQADLWPWPEPDPQSWWDDKRPKASEAADPLGGRRLPRGRRTVAIDNGVDPSTYRLWGLMPLQWQVLRDGEMILEIWVRPANSVRQSIVRVTVRQDGRGFVQGRAGLACCEADIGRRIGFDAELPAGAAQTFLALRNHPMWSSPKLVQVRERGASEGVCVDGVSYDLTLVVPGRSRTLHRACDSEAIGQVADALEPALRAALGHDRRFDVLYRGGANFSLDRSAYQELLAGGGALRPDPTARAEPPGGESAPAAEDASTPAAPAPASPR
jgi:hypothetical protein